MAGIQALINALWLVEAECFMMSASCDRFNYNKWRHYGLPEISHDMRAQAENRYAKELKVKQ